MKKGESVLIEKASNGFIVSPKEITSLTKPANDIHVSENFENLEIFLREHFEPPQAEKTSK